MASKKPVPVAAPPSAAFAAARVAELRDKPDRTTDEQNELLDHLLTLLPAGTLDA